MNGVPFRMARFPTFSCDCKALYEQCRTGYHWWRMDNGDSLLIIENEYSYSLRLFDWDGLPLKYVDLMKYGFVAIS